MEDGERKQKYPLSSTTQLKRVEAGEGGAEERSPEWICW